MDYPVLIALFGRGVRDLHPSWVPDPITLNNAISDKTEQLQYFVPVLTSYPPCRLTKAFPRMIGWFCIIGYLPGSGTPRGVTEIPSTSPETRTQKFLPLSHSLSDCGRQHFDFLLHEWVIKFIRYDISSNIVVLKFYNFKRAILDPTVVDSIIFCFR